MMQVKQFQLVLIVLSVHFAIVNGEKKYHIPVIKANWFKAVEFCHSLGMQLVTIDSREENDALAKFIQSTDKFNELKNEFWIGGSDLSEEGTFSWLGTGKLVTYANWSVNEPNNYHGIEDCMQLVYTPMYGQLWTWNDNICKKGHFYFICESVPKECIEEFK
uniref:Macrophage mannose receptor 1 n=1 Tax=Culex pipiens TaxID=7175 RepID=A0A8D8MYB1_CULPI